MEFISQMDQVGDEKENVVVGIVNSYISYYYFMLTVLQILPRIFNLNRAYFLFDFHFNDKLKLLGKFSI